MKNTETYTPPDEALEALARCLYPAIRAYYDSAEGQQEFAEWQAKKQDDSTHLSADTSSQK